MFEGYEKYLKDNPQGYWFKAKLYGWGWVPVKWQGWVAVLVYIVAIFLLVLTLDENSSGKEMVFTYFLPLLFLTVILLFICYKKGEKPKWQWGLPEKYKK